VNRKENVMKHSIHNIVVGAILAACIVALPGCVTCDPSWDTPTCKVNQAIAVGGQVDIALQALALALPILPPAVIATITAYHSAYPFAVAAARSALATYEATHAGDWQTALSILTTLYTDVTKLLTAAGHPGILSQAQATVTAQGVSQTLLMLERKGMIR
jgi:hypothetical protein